MLVQVSSKRFRRTSFVNLMQINEKYDLSNVKIQRTTFDETGLWACKFQLLLNIGIAFFFRHQI